MERVFEELRKDASPAQMSWLQDVVWPKIQELGGTLVFSWDLTEPRPDTIEIQEDEADLHDVDRKEDDVEGEEERDQEEVQTPLDSTSAQVASYNSEALNVDWLAIKEWMDDVYRRRIQLEQEEELALDAFSAFLRSKGQAGRDIAKDSDVDYLAWADDREKLNGICRRWSKAAKEERYWLEKERSSRQAICDFQMKCKRDAGRLLAAVFRRTANQNVRERTQKLQELDEFQTRTAKEATNIQGLHNNIVEQKNKATYQKRVASDQDPPPLHRMRLNTCSLCGVVGVNRGRDCPNRHNHPDFVPPTRV